MSAQLELEMTNQAQPIGVTQAEDSLLGQFPDSDPSPKAQRQEASSTAKKPMKLIRHLFYHRWFFEILTLILAYALLAAAAGVILYWDGKPVKDWSADSFQSPFIFSLSGFLSFLATLMKAAMISVVSSSIGQLKWHHFSKNKPQSVIDINRIDDVGRGVIGSVSYLFTSGPFHLVSTGAILTIAALLLNTAVVNMLNYSYGQNIPFTTNASLYIATQYHALGSAEYNETYQQFAPVDMQSAVLSGWWYPVSAAFEAPMAIKLDCESGTCQWENVSALEVQYACVAAQVYQDYDDSDYLYSTQAGIDNYVYPYDDMSHHATSDFNLVARRAMPTYSNLAAYGNDTIIMHLAALQSRDGTLENAEAVECALFWARTETYLHKNANFTFWTFGDVNETITDFVKDADENITTNKSSSGCHFGSNFHAGDSDGCIFLVSRNAHAGLQRFLTGFMTMYSYYDDRLGNGDFVASSPNLNAFSNLFGRFNETKGTLNTTLGILLHKVTASITLSVWASVDVSKDDQNSPNGVVYGSMQWPTRLMFKARWRWAAYPVAMLLLSTSHFAMTVWHTRKVPVWKNNALPMLYHGFGTGAETNDGLNNEAKDLGNMERIARQQKMMIVPSPLGKLTVVEP